MKKKIPVSIALVAILILTSVTALAVGTNLFNYFASRDARYGIIAEQAGKVTAAPVEVSSENLGTVNARIDSAYYDGQSLSVGFIIENAVRLEPCTLTAEELTDAEIVIDPVRPIASTEEEQRLMEEFSAAVENGTPFGYAMFKVYPSDHTSANGIDLPPYSSIEEYDDAGAYRTIRDFETPLPEALQDQAEIDLNIRLYETMNVHYFDGENIYQYSVSRRDAGAITATVPRADAEKRAYTGSAIIDGVSFSAEATLSAMQGKISLTADQDVFQPVAYECEGESWQAPAWELAIFDENGVEYRNPDGYSLSQLNPIEISIEGSGSLPEELHIYLLRADETPDTYLWWPDADGRLDNPHLVLTLDD